MVVYPTMSVLPLFYEVAMLDADVFPWDTSCSLIASISMAGPELCSSLSQVLELEGCFSPILWRLSIPFQPLHSVVTGLPATPASWHSSWSLSIVEATVVSSDTCFSLLSSLTASSARQKCHDV